MNMKLKIGDVVRFITEDVKMTMTYVKRDEIACVWYNEELKEFRKLNNI
jgi:uncharacterized protein YodC (DUF2158 family)